MVLALPVLFALALGLVLGGRLSGLAELRLRGTWLFLVALALQIVAFPFGFLPWSTGGSVATVLWLASYAILLVAAVLNIRVAGVPIVTSGMCLNLLAILANRGTMPVLPDAMREAGRNTITQANSTAIPDPHLGWLIDRWAAPDIVPLANVFSVGDAVIAVGAVVIVLSAMGARLPRLLKSRDAST